MGKTGSTVCSPIRTGAGARAAAGAFCNCMWRSLCDAGRRPGRWAILIQVKLGLITVEELLINFLPDLPLLLLLPAVAKSGSCSWLQSGVLHRRSRRSRRVDRVSDRAAPAPSRPLSPSRIAQPQSISQPYSSSSKANSSHWAGVRVSMKPSTSSSRSQKPSLVSLPSIENLRSRP